MSGKTPECFARWGFPRPGAAEVGACVGCPEGHKCMHATLMGIFSRMVWEAYWGNER
jgi:hypothetical protein